MRRIDNGFSLICIGFGFLGVSLMYVSIILGNIIHYRNGDPDKNISHEVSEMNIKRKGILYLTVAILKEFLFL